MIKNRQQERTTSLRAAFMRIEMHRKGVREHFFQLEREIADAYVYFNHIEREIQKPRARKSKKRGSQSGG